MYQSTITPVGNSHEPSSPIVGTALAVTYLRVSTKEQAEKGGTDCQWPVLGHRCWPSRSPHSSRVVQLVVGRPPVRVRAWSMR